MTIAVVTFLYGGVSWHEVAVTRRCQNSGQLEDRRVIKQTGIVGGAKNTFDRSHAVDIVRDKCEEDLKVDHTHGCQEMQDLTLLILLIRKAANDGANTQFFHLSLSTRVTTLQAGVR